MAKKLSTIPTIKLSNIDQIIDLVDSYQVGINDMGVGIRGLYQNQLNRLNLPQSNIWDDGYRTNTKLCGTCAVQVVRDWYSSSRQSIIDGLSLAAELVDSYGDCHSYGLVIGEPQNGGTDYKEIILNHRDNKQGGAKVIAYIDIK